MLADVSKVRSTRGQSIPTPYAYPRESVATLFRKTAEARPDATALRFRDQAVSYTALDRASDHVAQQLFALGHRSGDIVGISMKRTPQLVAALLGILKADGAYMPVDPAWPFSRLQVALRNSKARFLLSDTAEAPILPARIRTVTPDADLADITRWPDMDSAALPPIAGADDIAYVNFTSGSSGEPKGVMVPHRGITSLLFQANYTELSAETVTLFHAPPYFDGMTFELWAPLLHGGTAVLFDSDYPNISRLRRTIRENNVNVLLCTAAIFNVIVDTAPDTFETLSTVMTGGEALSPRHVRAAAAAHANLRIVNVYGPTEATTFSTFFDVSGLAPNSASVPIGVAVNNRSVFIAGPDLVPVPNGQVGEICVAGPGIALGYIGRPDLTAERFALLTRPEGQLEPVYRTGDLGRYDAQGAIEFCGRNDNQIKLNGYRIELEEIERCFVKHPDVLQALVVAHGEGARRALKALVVGSRIDSSSLRGFLSDSLPRHMLPSEFRVVAALPLKPNGKVDRIEAEAFFDGPSTD
ncbi:amino acid adenylation domain-containing protein [Leisingera daeponensis]|uniref:amino acid adenylation domain-containing protein n=1 Tax=Leisingera daeponensis TaxID=405746 RepID=UPI00041DA67D|nr:amino acid adenylation domain-containing protein [Leisingera daeponensis]